MTGKVLRAIPSAYVKAMTPPPGAVDRALAGVERLAAQDQDERLFGFLQPAVIRAHWDEGHRAIYVMLDGIRFWSVGWSSARNFSLRWTILEQREDWYDDGWLPDDRWAGLNAEWRARIWDAIQPPDARRLAIP